MVEVASSGGLLASGESTGHVPGANVVIQAHRRSVCPTAVVQETAIDGVGEQPVPRGAGTPILLKIHHFQHPTNLPKPHQKHHHLSVYKSRIKSRIKTRPQPVDHPINSTMKSKKSSKPPPAHATSTYSDWDRRAPTSAWLIDGLNQIADACCRVATGPRPRLAGRSPRRAA